MYKKHTVFKGDDWNYPAGYSVEESELIEDEGEAIEYYLERVVADGLADKTFTVNDEYSDEEIYIDITDYIGDETFNTFRDTIEVLPECILNENTVETLFNACCKGEI